MNEYIKLGDVAHVEISNIDKKSKIGEEPVRLCNFVDVYHNWAITNSTSKAFMNATASKNAINKFSIHKGQVAITKDSETRDDIGISTYIADNISNCVLGYHCALISPDESKLLGKYLNVVLHSDYAQRYFEANASGSGQRYTLTNQIIENFPVPFYPLKVQKQIGKIASYIDRKIDNNNSVSSQLQSMAKTIYNYWFLQFDFPDENGRPYKSSGGKMVWNEELKQEIPEGWKVSKLHDEMNCNVKTVHNFKNVKYINYLDTSSLTQNIISGITRINEGEKIPSRARRKVQYNDILFSTVRPNQKHYGLLKIEDEHLIVSTGFAVLSSKLGANYNVFYYLFLISNNNLNILNTIANSSVSSYPSINPDDILNLKIAIPQRMSDYLSLIKYLDNMYCMVSKKAEENQQLSSFRDFLLPMLINGQITLKE